MKILRRQFYSPDDSLQLSYTTFLLILSFGFQRGSANKKKIHGWIWKKKLGFDWICIEGVNLGEIFEWIDEKLNLQHYDGCGICDIDGLQNSDYIKKSTKIRNDWSIEYQRYLEKWEWMNPKLNAEFDMQELRQSQKINAV